MRRRDVFSLLGGALTVFAVTGFVLLVLTSLGKHDGEF
jgi:hypothetical protein